MIKRKLFIYVSGVYSNPDGTAPIEGNLGDMFGFHLVNDIINKNDLSDLIDLIPINQKTPKSLVEGEEVLFLVGSTINHINNFKNKSNITVIGCGNINGTDIIHSNNVNIIGVRGPLTKSSLKTSNNSKIVSDPGLLISYVYPTSKKPTKKIGYIIHSVDREIFFEKYPHLKQDLINNYQSPEKFVDELMDYEKIVSSSLHGIIFSHSFNKEVIPIKITDKIIGGDYKYNDYYSSIGLSNVSRINLTTTNSSFNYLFEDSFVPSKNKINSIKESQILEITQFLKNLLCKNY